MQIRWRNKGSQCKLWTHTVREPLINQTTVQSPPLQYEWNLWQRQSWWDVTPVLHGIIYNSTLTVWSKTISHWPGSKRTCSNRAYDTIYVARNIQLLRATISQQSARKQEPQSNNHKKTNSTNNVKEIQVDLFSVEPPLRMLSNWHLICSLVRLWEEDPAKPWPTHRL